VRACLAQTEQKAQEAEQLASTLKEKSDTLVEFELQQEHIAHEEA
jgi:hypothetical protein